MWRMSWRRIVSDPNPFYDLCPGMWPGPGTGLLLGRYSDRAVRRRSSVTSECHPPIVQQLSSLLVLP